MRTRWRITRNDGLTAMTVSGREIRPGAFYAEKAAEPGHPAQILGPTDSRPDLETLLLKAGVGHQDYDG